MEIPLTRPAFGLEEEEAVTRVVRSGWVLMGPEVEAFEREFASTVGAPYACALSSGTAALFLALRALGVGPGDEVVTVSHSFVATASAVTQCGASPVFVDIEPSGFNVDARLLEAAVGPRTRALLIAHQLGMPCDLEAIVALGAQRGIPVVEDAACALGSELLLGGQWRPIGRPEGHVACFSFHPRKVVTTGDGGMVTTRDPALDARLRRLRSHDLPRLDEVAWNFRLTDLQAALGRVQLARLPVLVAERRRLAAAYADLLAGVDGVDTPAEPSWARSNWQSYCVRLPGRAGLDVGARLAAEGIATRGGIANAHLRGAHAQARRASPLVESERAEREGLMLPLYPGMHEAEQRAVVEALVRALEVVAPSGGSANG
jgi:dTDP-4-amino-4,6-dideoxygalactose transaminase